MKLDFKHIEQALLDYNAKSELKQAAIIMVRKIFKDAESKQCNIPVVMQSCDTCKNLSTCRFWQEAPNNGATCKFYIEHVS